MNIDTPLSLAILYPGDRSARDRSDPAESRFRNLFDAFASAGVSIEPAISHDDFRDEVLQQLLRVDGILVWHNPVEGGRDRSQLDAMLRGEGCGSGITQGALARQLRMVRITDTWPVRCRWWASA